MKRTTLLTVIIIILTTFIVQAQTTSVPPLINYQGMLTDADGNPLAGTKKLEFNLYDTATGGNKIWGPQIFSNVPLINGQFNVILGTTDTEGRSITDAFSSDNCYLGIRVDDGQELSPRQQILSAPYSINAENAANANNADNANLLQQKNLDEVLSLARTPDFDSGWFTMQSQAGSNSYKEIDHNTGSYPSRVKILVRAIDGSNEGFIFEGSGTAQADDDGNQYGGVVFAYNETSVRMWAPSKNNATSIGRIINVADGWGGEINRQQSHSAQVKVLVWK